MEVQDLISPGEFQILNLIVKVLSGKLPSTLLFFYKDPAGQYGFTGIIPEGINVNKEFIAKFNELAGEYANSMAVIPKDDFLARADKLVKKWRVKTVDAKIEKNNDNSVNIKFNA